MRTRVPPPKSEYLEFLRPYGPQIAAVALAVRKLVMSEAPGSVELIYDAYSAVATGYSFTGRPSDACIHIAVYAKWVNLGFNRGSQLPDPEGRLKGSGNWIRHIRIASLEDMKDTAIRGFVKAAVERAVYPQPAATPKPESIVRAVYARRRRPGAGTTGDLVASPPERPQPRAPQSHSRLDPIKRERRSP